MGNSLASIGAVLALLACQTDKPEAQVRKAFESCRAAVEAGDAAGATARLDPGFKGPEGLDRATAQLFLLNTFRQEKVGVSVVRSEVMVRGKEAFQEVDVILTGHRGGLLPQDAGHRRYQLRWHKDGGDWRLLDLQSPEGR
jgi:hypothetical protein